MKRLPILLLFPVITGCPGESPPKECEQEHVHCEYSLFTGWEIRYTSPEPVRHEPVPSEEVYKQCSTPQCEPGTPIEQCQEQCYQVTVVDGEIVSKEPL